MSCLGWINDAEAFDWQSQTSDALRESASTQTFAIARAFEGERMGVVMGRLAEANMRAADDAAWIPATVACCRRLLDTCPPGPGSVQERRAVLFLLDYPLHVDNTNGSASPAAVAAYEAAAFDYERSALRRVLDEVATTTVSKGAVIWKVYNMGFVIKTKKHVFAIDITTSPLIHFTPPPIIQPGTPLEERQRLFDAYWVASRQSPRIWEPRDIERLSELLDALFITHEHGDHYSDDLVDALLAKTIPVVAPFARSKREPDETSLHAPRSTSFIECRSTTNVSFSVGGVCVTVIPGFQGDPSTPNNVYLFDVDGVRVTHNGDNTSREAEAGLARLPTAQILLANCWSGLASFIQAATASEPAERARQLVIPGHENELGHSVSHRESWRELYARPDRLGAYTGNVPVIPLSWGERIAYPLLR